MVTLVNIKKTVMLDDTDNEIEHSKSNPLDPE